MMLGSMGCAGAPPSPNAEAASLDDAETASLDDEAPEEGGEQPAPGEVRSAVRAEGEEACAVACDHVVQCTGGDEASDGCRAECQRELAQPSGAPALRYAGCVQGLSCAQIELSITSSQGPLGDCYLDALRMAR